MAKVVAFSLGLFVVAAGSLVAQNPPDTTRTNEAARIKGVLIEPSDVFPPEEATWLIPRLMNGLHVTTRPGTIRRELLLRPGELFDSAKAAESERNLRFLRVFRMAKVDSVRSDSGLLLRATTRDAFSIVPFVSIGGSLTDLDWGLGLAEFNVLGTAARASARYRHTTFRDAVNLSVQRDRLFDGRVGVAALYDWRTDGRQVYGVVSLPYLSFSARSSWYLSAEDRDERVLQFRNGVSNLAAVNLQHRYSLGRVGVGRALTASAAGYVHVGIDGQLRRDDYAVRSRLDSLGQTVAGRLDTLGNTVTGALTAYVQWRSAKFLVSKGFQGFGREEDVDLSTVVGFGLGLTPKAFGYPDNGIVPNLGARVGLGWAGGFATLSGSVLGRIRESGSVDSGSASLSGLLVLKQGRRHITVLHAARGWQKNPAPGAEFEFGKVFGPRGFDNHAFTGNQAFLLTGEYRYLLTDRFLRSAALGLAGFADYGGAWFAGSPKRTGYSVGVGVRFGFTVTTDISPARLDLVYFKGSGLEKGRWGVRAGKGFIFGTNGRLDR